MRFQRFYSSGKEDIMPRVNPYRPQYGGDPTAATVIFSICIAAAVILGILLWAGGPHVGM
jgi:hypothetical protein